MPGIWHCLLVEYTSSPHLACKHFSTSYIITKYEKLTEDVCVKVSDISWNKKDHHENSYLLQCYPVSMGALFPVNTAFLKPSVLHLQGQSVQEGGLVNSY